MLQFFLCDLEILKVHYFRWIALAILGIWPIQGTAQSLESTSGRLQIEAKVTNLKTPWAFGFLPEGALLITQRGGSLLHVDASGRQTSVSGLPSVRAKGQGGLLDVLVPRDFARRREIFLTFSKKQPKGAGTAVARARLSPDGTTLTDMKVIFEMSPGSSGGRHFGSRLVEARDGNLFVTIGERGEQMSAQDLTRHNGSILRISRDGASLRDNPFVARKDVLPEIWSYGHRNPQGAALDLAGHLWAVEHGAKGGDEVNRILKGANYGWPVISYGRHYSGDKIGEGTTKSGMQQPRHYWDPSIAPSGMVIYSGRLWPQWRGDIFIGSLKLDYISRLSARALREVEKLRGASTKRVRDIREAPDGSLWFLSEERGTLYRMSPAR